MRSSLFKLTRLELPANISYRLGRFLNSYSKEWLRADNARIDLVKKYGEETGDGGDHKVKSEHQKQFREEFAKLLEEEVELEIQEPVKLSELGDISLTPLDFANLQKIIKEE